MLYFKVFQAEEIQVCVPEPDRGGHLVSGVCRKETDFRCLGLRVNQSGKNEEALMGSGALPACCPQAKAQGSQNTAK